VQQITTQSQRLDGAFYGPMQLDSDIAHLRDIFLIIQQLKTTLQICKIAVSTLSSKSRLARILRFLHSTKERLKGEINPYTRILKDLRMNLFDLRMLNLFLSEHIDSIVEREID
jgi:DNA polymerase sigma